jgi:hypothetical protein
MQGDSELTCPLKKGSAVSSSLVATQNTLRHSVGKCQRLLNLKGYEETSSLQSDVILHSQICSKRSLTFNSLLV